MIFYDSAMEVVLTIGAVYVLLFVGQLLPFSLPSPYQIACTVTSLMSSVYNYLYGGMKEEEMRDPPNWNGEREEEHWDGSDWYS